MNGNNNAKVCFKNCSPFIRCVTHLNDEHFETAENLDPVMNLYNLIEYSDNYEQTSESLFQYKRQEQNLKLLEILKMLMQMIHLHLNITQIY